ncbi:MAG: hypothetical protein JWN73_4341 [Betaproteobacteria bacterium]|nr:hypothetical protein [Betaproteobacteria bacterium]
MKKRVAAFAVMALLGFLLGFYLRAYFVSFDPLAEKLVDESAGSSVLMFGDSVLSTPAACDTDRRAIDEMVSASIHQPVLAIKHGAYSASIYEHYVDLLGTRPVGVKSAIVPVNLAALSAAWGDLPIYQFTLSKSYIDVRAHKAIPLRTLWNYLVVGHVELDRQWYQESDPLFDGTSVGSHQALSKASVGRTLDCGAAAPTPAENEQLKVEFLWHYGVPARRRSETLAALRNTVAKLKALHIKPLVYLTPIDVDDAALKAGASLRRHIDDDAGDVVRLISAEDVDVLDLHAALDSSYFMDKRYATEHLTQAGRAFVANKIAAWYSAGSHN